MSIIKDKGVIVSVRIPSTLVKKLKIILEKEDFMDLSEAIRSIIRNKWIIDNKSEKFVIDRSNTKIRNELLQKCMQITQDKMLTELKNLQRNVNNELEDN